MAMNQIQEIMSKSEYTYGQLKKAVTEKLPEITPQDLTGKVVIVTGANVGIGYETTKSLATMNPRLIVLACRNLEKANDAITRIQKETGFSRLEALHLDLALLESVRSFARSFVAKNLPLDILVSNAGTIGTPEWVLTDDGLEIVQQVNHVASVLLVLLLTPALRKAQKPRVVIVSSDDHFWASLPSPDDPHPLQTVLSKEKSSHFVPITSSKLFNILFAKEYARRSPFHVDICTANPSLTESEFGSKDPKSGQIIRTRPNFGFVLRTTYEGAKSIIYAAITPDVKPGAYYSDMTDYPARSTTQGEVGARFAANVWKDTIEILKGKGNDAFEGWVEN